VDRENVFCEITETLEEIATQIRVIFPMHPRTAERTKAFRISFSRNVLCTDPLGYLDFLTLESHARFVMTDSGGIQEEATALGIPCLTLRENTERPITVEQGTNVIVGTKKQRILSEALPLIEGFRKRGRLPELWDGATAGRIVQVLKKAMLCAKQ
jgi:UDP-N-acetylglucosamine 2-epimerase (non-hydrolysing)